MVQIGRRGRPYHGTRCEKRKSVTGKPESANEFVCLLSCGCFRSARFRIVNVDGQSHRRCRFDFISFGITFFGIFFLLRLNFLSSILPFTRTHVRLITFPKRNQLKFVIGEHKSVVRAYAFHLVATMDRMRA